MKHRYFKSLLAILFLMVGAKAFAYGAKINGIYYNFSGTEATVTYLYYEKSSNSSAYSGNVVIPASVTYKGETYTVTRIGYSAFYGCSSLTSITIPESVTRIGSSAFYGCSSLTSITIPESVTNIDSYAFNGCSSLISINIPEGITSISDYVFQYCSSLTSITIPEGVTSIGKYAFNGCSSLISINIPEGITSISDYVFHYCSSLTSITIPEGVTSIRKDAFSGCSSLTSVTIPNSVTSIGNYAFDGCRCNIYMQSSEPPSIAMYTFSEKCYISIPRGSLNSYLSNSQWNDYLDHLTEGPAFVRIDLFSQKDYKLQYWLAPHFLYGDESLFGECGIICNGIKHKADKGVVNINLTPSKKYVLNRYYTYDGEEYLCGRQEIETDMPWSAEISEVKKTQTSFVGKISFSVDESGLQFDESGIKVCYNAEDNEDIKIVGDEFTITGLEPMTSISLIPYYVFNGDTILGPERHDTKTLPIQTTITEVQTTKTTISGRIDVDYGDADQQKYSISVSCYEENGDTVRQCKMEGVYFSLDNLMPASFYSLYCGMKSNDNLAGSGSPNDYYSTRTTIWTKGIGLNTQYSTTSTSVDITTKYDSDELDITSENYSFGKVSGNGATCFFTGLDPSTSYEYKFTVRFSNGYVESFTCNISTRGLAFTTSQPKVISEGNVIVAAESNINDEETNVGFEWRRTDWTDDFASNTGGAYIYEGTMEGYIRNLNANYLWKFRPYYLSNSGKYYYGDWVGIDPSNTSYFEPTVHTYSKIQIQGNTALVKGYALRGTDNVAVQGFKYWKTVAGAKAANYAPNRIAVPNDAKTVEATGQVMTANLKDLDYDTEYCYVAFVTTSEGETFYGEQQTFVTEADLTPVEELKAENAPASIIARYDVQGRRLNKPIRGINIILMSDGTKRKVIMK